MREVLPCPAPTPLSAHASANFRPPLPFIDPPSFDVAIVRAHARGLDRPAYLCGPPDHMALFEVSFTSLSPDLQQSSRLPV